MSLKFFHPRPRAVLGFSLIELMIGMVIGLVFIGLVIGFYANTADTNNDMLKATRLEQELRATMDLIAGDIRRAGHWGNAVSMVNTGANSNPFDQINSTRLCVLSGGTCILDEAPSATLAANGSCIQFAFDLDFDGTDDGNGERFGYALDGGRVETRSNSSGANCAASPAWQPVTDENVITIDALTFALTRVYAGTDSNSDTFGDVQVRTVDITLTGHLNSDTGVTRTIRERVRIRNDAYL
jgi:type IV pilus assembly protein PilW